VPLPPKIPVRHQPPNAKYRAAAKPGRSQASDHAADAALRQAKGQARNQRALQAQARLRAAYAPVQVWTVGRRNE
jgi:hypothetical protein